MTQIIQSDISGSLADRFLTYATYVIADRALPDARDGLKPVQRRVLYSMNQLGLGHNKPYKKSARTVGDVLGQYHPHGDSSVYGSLVQMAQPFKMRYPLVNGHGNFGSIDGDTAAAMRYTESKLALHGDTMMNHLSNEVVDFVPNFDESTTEPSVLPTMFPNLLANGTTGIAVSMATSIPPHHAGSLYEAIKLIINNEMEGTETSIEELIKIVQAPDFPTGAYITNLSDIHKGYRTGKGRVVMRSKYEIEDVKGHQQIVVTEIPFKVNKSTLVEQIDNVRKNYMDKDIKEVRDESDKDGIRVVIELKKDANAEWIVKKLLKQTDLQCSFSMNMVALFEGRPKQFTLKDALESFLAHVANVIIRRTQYQLAKANRRMHIVEGILICLESIDEVVQTIKASKTNAEVIVNLMNNHGLTEEQAKSIAEMKLRSISQASAEQYAEEHQTLTGDIQKYTEILNDNNVLLTTMYHEIEEVSSVYKDERRSEILLLDNISDDERELIKDESLIVTMTNNGIIKSVNQTEYQAKGRGTKGVKSSNMKDDDSVRFMFAVNSRDDLLFFTNKGRCHVLEVYKLPVLSKSQAGKYMTNYISMDPDEVIVNVLPKEAKKNDEDLLLVTKLGIAKRLELSSLSSRMKVTRVISFREDDELVAVNLFKDQEIVILTAGGQAIRFDANAEGKGIRPMGRTAAGVKGIRLREDDYVISMTTTEEGKDLLLVTENGIGKRVAFEQFPTHSRGGQGVRAIGLTEKTGILQCAVSISDEDDLLIATKNGILSRIDSGTIRPMGRAAAGVKVINLSEGDEVVSISPQQKDEQEEEEVNDNE